MTYMNCCQDVLMLCVVYGMPKPRWNSRGAIPGACYRGNVATYPTVDPKIVLKVCDDMTVKTLRGVVKAYKIGLCAMVYVWCDKTDKKMRHVLYETVLR